MRPCMCCWCACELRRPTSSCLLLPCLLPAACCLLPAACCLLPQLELRSELSRACTVAIEKKGSRRGATNRSRTSCDQRERALRDRAAGEDV